MQLSAVLLARVILFIESFDLNPRGKAYYPDIVGGIVEKCGFLKFPQKIEDFDESKGVEFAAGRWGHVTIETMKIFKDGLMIDTRASTGESERVLREALSWSASTFGLTFDPQMIKRKSYVSNLTFHTEVPILGGSNSPVSRLAQRANDSIARITGDNTPWQPIILTLNSGQIPRKPTNAPFTIQRRAEIPFSENKYYSEAPFPTEVHIALLEQFEEDVKTTGA
jgi:hypothetical protein